MRKKIISILVFIIISTLILTNNLYVFAASTSSLKSNISEIDNNIQNKKHQLDAVESEKKQVLTEVEDLIYKISDYEGQISELNTELSTLENKIKESQERLEKEEQNYKEQDEAMQERITVMYEKGETTFLDMLLGSNDLMDFISNYYLASLITEADNERLEEIERKKNEIAIAKEALETDKQKLEQTKKNKEAAQTALSQTKAIKDKKVSELSSEEKELQAELEKFEAEKKAIEAELKRIAEEEARRAAEAAAKSGSNTTYVTVSPSSCGYISPIPGTTRNSITCGFYGYSGHGGVDFGGHYGEKVVAVKAGTVEISRTSYGSIPNYDLNGNYIGSYSSYGEYIVINHHDGTMTLYAHGKPGSRLVSSGQSVSQGQQIMTVGNTGNVLPRPSSSSPRNGAHLHFEVRVNGSRVNPYNYLP